MEDERRLMDDFPGGGKNKIVFNHLRHLKEPERQVINKKGITQSSKGAEVQRIKLFVGDNPTKAKKDE